MKDWITQLQPIIDEFKDGSNDPLNGDDVDELARIIKAKLNLQEGNITQEDYEAILDRSCIDEKAIQIAAHYICNDNVEEAIKLIKAQYFKDGSVLLDEVDGVIVWEAVTDRYTVDKFIELIY